MALTRYQGTDTCMEPFPRAQHWGKHFLRIITSFTPITTQEEVNVTIPILQIRKQAKGGYIRVGPRSPSEETVTET